jgi:hypothetical protein
VGELLRDLALPETDRGAVTQWVVMGAVWIVVLAWSLRWRREYRLFALGLATVNAAWFAARTIH